MVAWHGRPWGNWHEKLSKEKTNVFKKGEKSVDHKKK